MPSLRLPFISQLPRVVRQLEQDVDTVINVLQPGPLGIVEYKFSAEEVQQAKITVKRAIENWKINVALERSVLHQNNENKADYANSKSTTSQ